MKLFLIKPDLSYYTAYNDMMQEWVDSKTKIAPWFLDKPCKSLEEFEKLIVLLDQCEKGNQDKKFASTTSYFVIDENKRLIGAASLRHYLTIKGLNSWGHVGYGVRPTERHKGYATQILKLILEEAKNQKIYKVLVGSYKSNIGSCKVIENNGGVLENEVVDKNNPTETIKRYWIDNF